MGRHTDTHIHVNTLLGLKKEGILTNAAAWMNLEDLMLNEVSHRKIYEVLKGSQNHIERK
jgi:hypothetical protein